MKLLSVVCSYWAENRVDKKVLGWEILGFIFIVIAGSFLHFAFELSGFSAPVAVFAAVNESTWEHLKLVFWPGLIFAYIEYNFFRGNVSNFWHAKAVCLVLMPIIISVGWYGAIAITGENVFLINIFLFIAAAAVGQWVSYWVMTTDRFPLIDQRGAIAGILLMILAFSIFTFYPPKFFLFEHLDLMNTGDYGILDNYEDLMIFRR